MKLNELLDKLAEHKDKKGVFQIHLNSGNLEENSQCNEDVEFGDLYFSNVELLRNGTLLCFTDGSSNMFIEIEKIESIEKVEDFADWFEFPSSMVVNLYMFPDNRNLSGSRNVVTIGFME